MEPRLARMGTTYSVVLSYAPHIASGPGSLGSMLYTASIPASPCSMDLGLAGAGATCGIGPGECAMCSVDSGKGASSVACGSAETQGQHWGQDKAAWAGSNPQDL